MEDPPYRAMPLPKAPPREWRPILQKALAVFNALAFVYAVIRSVQVSDAFTFYVGAPFALATAGFSVRGRRGLRTCLILPSSLIWGLLAPYFPMRAHVFRAYDHMGHRPLTGLTIPYVIGFFCAAVAALTIESAVSLLRLRPPS